MRKEISETIEDEQTQEVTVTVEKKKKQVTKKAPVGRPKKLKTEKKKQIAGGFTPDEEERMIKVLEKNNLTSTAHFMRTAGLKLLEELEKLQ